MYILGYHSLYKGVYTIVYMKDTNKLQKLMNEINEEMRNFNVPEEILDREIKPFGNASHIILPKEFANKKAKVIIKK